MPYFPYIMTPFPHPFLSAPVALENVKLIQDCLLEQEKQPSIKVETD
jgi:hypothetical protein